MIHGQDIAHEIKAHELARILLAGPDLPVTVPDAFEGDESECENIGRITSDSTQIYLCAYFLNRCGMGIDPHYRHEGSMIVEV